MTVTVSSRWQMVIPTQIRKKYNIQPQTKVELIDKGKEIVLVPLPENPILSARGLLKGITTDDLIKLRRGEKKHEQLKAKKYGLSS